MKKWILILSIAGMANAAEPRKAEEITFDFLLKTGIETGYCDHIPHMEKIFNNYKVKNLLEFGLGYSTKYFLDRCTKVISVEFVTSAVKPDWLKYSLDLYKAYSNWIPVAYFSNYSGDFSWAPYKYFASINFYEAEKYHAATLRLPSDQSFISELRTFIGNLTKFNKIDVAIVDPASLLRGPIVQLLFDKAPIIMACDCGSSYDPVLPDIYGYRMIEVPENYQMIYIPKGKGTLLWIKMIQETEYLIDLMKEYSESF